jgi:hypothetical protein
MSPIHEPNAGKEQLATERTRRAAALGHGVGTGNLDDSFWKFLNRNTDLNRSSRRYIDKA